MTTRARTRRRQAARVANRRADWQIRVVVPGPAPRVMLSLPLPLLRRLTWDASLRADLEHSASTYAEVNRL